MFAVRLPTQDARSPAAAEAATVILSAPLQIRLNLVMRVSRRVAPWIGVSMSFGRGPDAGDIELTAHRHPAPFRWPTWRNHLSWSVCGRLSPGRAFQRIQGGCRTC